VHIAKYPEGTAYSKLPKPAPSALPDEIENGGLPKLQDINDLPLEEDKSPTAKK
jgi:hypothetical protein